jgi:hypothetical protein
MVAAGCASSFDSRGATRKQYAGDLQLVFTNASPAQMCELRMSFDDTDAFGDNWLPKGGLASGKSIDFHVQPGKYKAMWSTCKDEPSSGFFAATLIQEMAITVDQETQLFAYVADTVAPTKRAAVLSRDYRIVRFQGQAIAPIGTSAPVPVDAFAQAEREIGRNSGQKAPEVEEPTRFEKLGANDFVDPEAKKTRKKKGKGAVVKPSLKRGSTASAMD